MKTGFKILLIGLMIIGMSCGVAAAAAPTFNDGGVTPGNGEIGQDFTFTANFSDADNDSISVNITIDGIDYEMNESNSGDTNYSDGKDFYFDFTPGTTHDSSVANASHPYNFSATAAGDTTGPSGGGTFEILNTKPSLINQGVSSTSGNNSTNFDFTVTFTDANNDSAAYVNVTINGTEYGMNESNSGDDTTIDGKDYEFNKSGSFFGLGIFDYFFTASDGTDTADPTSTESFTVNNAPQLDGSVSPSTGSPTTTFYFNATYTDLDNQTPSTIQVYINSTHDMDYINGTHDMDPVDTGDTDYTDGKNYTYNMSGFPEDTYSYHFEASDGTETVTYTNTPDTFDSAVSNHEPTIDGKAEYETGSNIVGSKIYFNATYKDQDNNESDYVRVVIKGDTHNMSKVSSNNPEDGVDYSYNTTSLGEGNYTYQFFASDGTFEANSSEKTVTIQSSTYYWGNRIWEEGNQSTTYTWNGRSFSGFYYDLDTGDTSESMTITIDVDGREIEENALLYSTVPISKEFEYNGWDNYQIIGFMAERYFAGYKNTSTSIVDSDLSLMSDGILSKVLLDTDDDESIYSGSSLALEEGYNLNIQQVDVNGDSVWISLTQDGDEVDDAILSSGDTYVYEKDLGGVDDVPVIAVHIEDVFSGTETNAVFIDGIFQISDDYVEIDEGDEYGEMTISNVGKTEIEMKNEDGSIDLDEGDIIDIMGKLKFIVADDNDVLRFAPFVDMSEPGTYELRGTIAEDQGFTWTPLNFEGFYYDIDEGLSSESLTVEYDGRSIDEGNLTYKAEPVPVDFEYNNWGKYNVIGFMAEKYFAGYDDSEFGGEIYDSDLMSSGQLSKVLIDDDDEKSVYTGSSLILEEGYALNIQEIDVNGERVMVELTRDGDDVESGIISSNDEYVYEKDVGDEDDVPIIVVHFNEVFSGTETSAVFVEGIFQISEDYEEVEDGDTFGEMEVTGTSPITLKNEDSIDLDEDSTIDIMGEIKFKVADDSSNVRYYPFVEVETEPDESLDIDIEPTTVVEGEEITFTVTSRGASIRDASILIDDEKVGTTSDEGVFEYDTGDAGTFTATAEKEGYVSSKGSFEVISPEDESKKISIEVSPEEVFEGTPITISVVKAIGSEPLEDAEVFFDGTSLGETDEDGTITYNPKEPGTHKLEAKVDGYLDAELNIKVNELAANFEFSNLRIDPLPATAGEEFTVMLESTNTGNAEGSYTVELSINDNVTDSQEITLGQNNSTTVEFTSTAGEPGTYLVKAGGLSTTMDVEEGTSIVWYALGGLILAVGGGAAYVFATGGTAKFAEIAESLRSMLGR
ncbi:S-layer protein [Methanohalophilus sp. RSK]|uniref:S-layer protein domain-containing protein n=1 Tax=Methanohalophilus sp. RSK TaxID=2485783 RepID=UPI000F43E146|nr:S-layer protein domain-containing protein [Methanohalophilus sp. RSK]RNI13708.1 S-layer protein [Methanohalophilus sp. RSK]